MRIDFYIHIADRCWLDEKFKRLEKLMVDVVRDLQDADVALAQAIANNTSEITNLTKQIVTLTGELGLNHQQSTAIAAVATAIRAQAAGIQKASDDAVAAVAAVTSPVTPMSGMPMAGPDAKPVPPIIGGS